MQARIIPYSELFVTVTMNMDETVALSSALSGLHDEASTELRRVLEEAVERAARLQEKGIHAKVDRTGQANKGASRRSAR